MSRLLSLFATSPKGVASLLLAELEQLGASELREQPAGVLFRGDLECAYRVCLWSRCASRVLLQIAGFDAADAQQLYHGIREIEWAEHLAPDGSLAVDLNSSRSAITHTRFGALKVKDAIVDQFRERTGQRPSVDIRQPDLRINLHLHRNRATVSLDLSGESLHWRGYRREGGSAPLKENLAAALLLRAGWPGLASAGGALLDPMCGSATLSIEAALIAGDIAPGILRERFGFHGWRQHDDRLWQRLRDEALERRARGRAAIPVIIGYDADRTAVRGALANLEAAGLTGLVHVERRELHAVRRPGSSSTGLVVVNPPYGERLGALQELTALYGDLADLLKREFNGWQAAIFTGNPELARGMGLRARRIYSFHNGAIPCRLLRFDLQPEWFVERRVVSGGMVLPPPATPQELGAGAQMFANRLRKNIRELGRWARREGVSCYRLYDADMPEYALAIDLYHTTDGERHLLVQEYQAPQSIDARKAQRRLREALALLPGVLEVPRERIHFKLRRRQRGSSQYEKLAAQERFLEVEEGGCRLLVNLADYLDSGLFLDHRPTRAMIATLASGRSFLNLFAYTGSATVHAARGGARETTTVDMSRTYLDWARRNMERNGFGNQPRHRFVHADCVEWLRRESRREGRRYDLIFLDPPTFSTSRRMERPFDIQRDHGRLIRSAAALLAPQGVLIFSCNFRRFRMERSALEGLELEEISHKTIPRDFARSPKIHCCWRITRSAVSVEDVRRQKTAADGRKRGAHPR